MLSRTKLLATGCVLAASFALGPAMAAAPTGFVGTLSGGYSNSSLDCSACGSTDNWGFGGQGAFGLGTSDLAAEGDVSYRHSSSGGFDSDLWGLGGNLFWNPEFGRFGGTFTYSRLSVPGPDFDLITYGGFGEFFASDIITVGGNIGGMHISVSGSSADGMYLNGGGTLYPFPDLGITPAIGYFHFDHGVGSITTYGVAGEWLFSEMLPVSITAGYQRADLPHGIPDANIFSVGLKFYMGGEGMSLVSQHRNGALDSLTSVSTIGIQTLF